uniref:Uncharacterized protein n=1 Tax=Anguilla anguilla TaxID=7936 RepID=A0A0E9T0M1_ANGAN
MDLCQIYVFCTIFRLVIAVVNLKCHF